MLPVALGGAFQAAGAQGMGPQNVRLERPQIFGQNVPSAQREQ